MTSITIIVGRRRVVVTEWSDAVRIIRRRLLLGWLLEVFEDPL